MKKFKLIILDRDGVINYESEEYVKSPDEWLPIPGSLEAIAKLTQAGYKIAIATNQAGVGRGIFTEAALHSMHDKMANLLKPLGGKIDGIFYCPHHPEDNCGCRKPKTGLLEQIAEHFAIDFKQQSTPVPFIGDSMRDIEAALAMNLKPILVLTGYGETTRQLLPPELLATPCYENLSVAIQALLSAEEDHA